MRCTYPDIVSRKFYVTASLAWLIDRLVAVMTHTPLTEIDIVSLTVLCSLLSADRWYIAMYRSRQPIECTKRMLLALHNGHNGIGISCGKHIV